MDETMLTPLTAGLQAGADAPVTPEELWQLTARQAVLYTGGSDSSLPNETVTELAASVVFSLRLGAQDCEGTPQALLAAGQKRIGRLLQQAGSLLRGVQATATQTRNLSYIDTLRGLPGFFRQYDSRFFAHQIPCDIDYPLHTPPPAQDEGVVYMLHYLQSLLCENRFCALFPAEALEALLASHSPEYEEEYLNLYTLAATAALGGALAGLPPGTLPCGDRIVPALTERLAGLPPTALSAQLAEAADSLLAAWPEASGADAAYLHGMAESLAPRLWRAWRADQLAALFPPAGGPRAASVYSPPPPLLPPARLRALLGEMRTCRNTSDKLAMLCRHVRHPDDMLLFLDHCFEESEYAAVFTALSPEQITALCRALAERDAQDPPPYAAILARFAP